jgi:hypothetical protein
LGLVPVDVGHLKREEKKEAKELTGKQTTNRKCKGRGLNGYRRDTRA